MRHPGYTARYSAVPITSALLTTTLHNSVCSDTEYSVPFRMFVRELESSAVLMRWSNLWEWDWPGMWHACGGREMYTGIWRENLTERLLIRQKWKEGGSMVTMLQRKHIGAVLYTEWHRGVCSLLKLPSDIANTCNSENKVHPEQKWTRYADHGCPSVPPIIHDFRISD